MKDFATPGSKFFPLRAAPIEKGYVREANSFRLEWSPFGKGWNNIQLRVLSVLWFIPFQLNGYTLRCIHSAERELIKVLTALMGRLSLSVGWENGSKWGQNCFIKPLASSKLSKQCRPWSEAVFWGVWYGLHCLPMSQSRVKDNPLYTALWHHSNKNLRKAAINNRNLDFLQTCGLISLVNDNHVDNNLYENVCVCILWLDCKKKKKKKKKIFLKMDTF